MDDSPLDQLDGLFSEEFDQASAIELLVISSQPTFSELDQLLYAHDGYKLDWVEEISSALPKMIEKTYPIIFISTDLADPIQASHSLTQINKLSRVVLFGRELSVEELSEVYNQGKIHTILSLPCTTAELLKKISIQEARYHIREAVTNFVSEPPKLSKASFLLLDPKLAEGDENTPLNFVGVMIICDTVPRYTAFFEKTLAQDEYLFAGYLSSITSMGKELFQQEETLKEINFGGISVIFRFVDQLQIAFLVKNLTNFNVNKAENRIDQLMSELIGNYKEALTEDFLSDKVARELNELFDRFDQIDEDEREMFQKMQNAKEAKVFGTPHILILGVLGGYLQELYTYLNIKSQSTKEFNVLVCPEEVEAHQYIREKNIGVLILDDSAISGKSAVFMAETIEELDPSVQIIYSTKNQIINQELVDLLDGDNIDYIYYPDYDADLLDKHISDAIDESTEIKIQTEMGEAGSGSADIMSVAKAKLKGDLGSFDSMEKPNFEGMVLARSMEPIFQKFWEIDGVLKEFDIEMFTGLVTSLKQISGEMFTEQAKIDGLEVSDSNVFVRTNSDFMFIYFVKNVNPKVVPLIGKEFDAVTRLLSEIIIEAKGLPLDQLSPIFTQIAEKTRTGFTELLIERDTE